MWASLGQKRPWHMISCWKILDLCNEKKNRSRVHSYAFVRNFTIGTVCLRYECYMQFAFWLWTWISKIVLSHTTCIHLFFLKVRNSQFDENEKLFFRKKCHLKLHSNLDLVVVLVNHKLATKSREILNRGFSKTKPWWPGTFFT